MQVHKALRCGAASLALLAAAACGDSANPTATELTATDQQLSIRGGNGGHTNSGHGNDKQDYNPLPSNLLLRRNTELPQNIVASTTVTPARGGWLQIDAAGLVVYFPPNAVTSDLVVTVTAMKGSKVWYTFEPHGTQFNQPIWIGQLLLNTEANVPRGKSRPELWAGYLANGDSDILPDGTGAFAETFDAWLYGQGNDTYALFSTTHFSGYALASGRRPTGE